jgi:hypothetical protein
MARQNRQQIREGRLHTHGLNILSRNNRKGIFMTEGQKAVLDTVKKLGIASELEINKNCTYTYRCIHNALRTLKRNGILDTDDDGSYFVVLAEVEVER